MENWKTEESVDSLEVRLKHKRSLLLMVICILTWVWSGLTFLWNTIAFSSSGLRILFVNAGNGFGAWYFMDWFLFPVLCSVGAIFMFRLKKWGFWIYCLGQIPPIIFSTYAMLGITKSLGSGVFFGLLQNGVHIGFLIMYAVEMNKLSRKPISTDF